MSAISGNIMDSMVFVECCDMAVLVSSMLLGWFTWSSLCRFATQRQQKLHLRSKVAYLDADVSYVRRDSSAPRATSTEDLQVPDVDNAQKVRWLLESYGAFGATPGTWDAASAKLNMASEALAEEEGEHTATESDDSDWELVQDSGASLQAVTESSLGLLFDHYSLFGAAPGAWSKDGSCTGRASESESAETQEVASDSSFDEDVDTACLEDLVGQ